MSALINTLIIKFKASNISVAKITSLFITPILFISPTLAHANVNNNIHNNGCNLPKSYFKNVRCTSDSRYFLAIKDTGEPVALLDKFGKESANLTKYQDVMENIIQDGLMPVMNKGKVGYINGKGIVAVPTVYDSLGGASWARAFSDSRAVVKKKGNWGVINTANKVIVPFSSRIDNISDFSNKTAEIVKSGKLYTVSTSGSMQSDSSSNVARNHSDSKYKRQNTVQKPAKSNSRKTSVEATANNHKPQKNTPKIIAKAKVNTEVSLSDDRIVDLLQSYNILTPDSLLFNGDKKVMLNNKQPKPISQRVTDVELKAETVSTHESLINSLVKENNPKIDNIVKKSLNTNKIAYYSYFRDLKPSSTNNQSPIPVPVKMTKTAKYNTVNNSRKIFPHSKNDKWGFVNVDGVDMIDYAFDEVMPFSNELAAVRVAEKWGFINKAGDLVINFQFSNQDIIRDGKTYHGMPPLMFFDGKAWVGNLSNGGKICIDTYANNEKCF